MGGEGMYISARERKILDLLLHQQQELTVKELAAEIDVSVRTIHRDLKGVEDLLKEFELVLIKKSGVGIRVVGAEEQINALHMFLYSATHNEYTPDERQTIILCSLLESSEPVKLIGLAHDLNVTIATISNDLTKLEEKLQRFDLSLIRRRGYGVALQGTESAKRRAMSNLIAKNVDEFQFLSLVREAIQNKGTLQTNSISEKLLGLVEKRKLLLVEKVLEELNGELPYSIADSAYIGLVIHLALAIERILQGENIQIEQTYLDSLKGTIEYQVAEQVIDKLEKVFDIQIPQAEIGYITMHLRGAKLRYDKEYLLEDNSFNIALKAKGLIQYVEQELGVHLGGYPSLFQGLVAHLRPAMYRIKENMGINNPLLEKIKEDYAELFGIVRQGVEQFFDDVHVPDEEVGYLVLHFGSALLGQVNANPVKTLIICSSGIGTSKILATRLCQEIPEIKDPQNASLFELQQLQLEKYDLVLSTIHAPELPEDYILVNPILTEAEISKIKARIRGRGSKKERLLKPGFIEPQALHTEEVLAELKEIHQYSETILAILNTFQLTFLPAMESSTEVMYEACKHLAQYGVLEQVDTVQQALIEREEIGGLGIPQTKLALYHARSTGVLQPSFTIYSLEQPLQLLGMDQEVMVVEQILVLLCPEEAPKPLLEVLSYISTLIIENEQSMALFESQEQGLIADHLTHKFAGFFQEKLRARRNLYPKE